MIPKIIHYCWFGQSPKPRLARKCIASWKKYCPDYQIIEWNENVFDVNMNEYTKKCYDQKKYAFLSDYARLWIVQKYGGVYFDTDVELLRNPDQLLFSDSFWGFETDGINSDGKQNRISGDAGGMIASGLGFGSISNGLAINAMLKEYDSLLDGEHGVIVCPQLNTSALVKIGAKRDGTMQQFDWGVIYPREYFNPFNNNTGEMNITENTYSIHWYSKSWLDRKTKFRSTITRPFHRFLGDNCFVWLKKIINK